MADFANISRSAEVPTFDVNSFSSPQSSNVKAQTATTYEIGTRGNRPDFNWDISLYRADVRDELQCLTTGLFGFCTTVNADKTYIKVLKPDLNWPLPNRSLDSNDRVSGSTPPIPTTTSSSTATQHLETISFQALPRIIFALKCSTGTQVDFMRARVSIGSRSMYCRQRQRAQDRPLCAFELPGRLRSAGWLVRLLEGRNLLDKRYISSTVTIGDGHVMDTFAGLSSRYLVSCSILAPASRYTRVR